MHCPTREAEATANQPFCQDCGSSLQDAPNPTPHASSELLRGADGVLRWTYEMSFWRNPALFITVIKVLLLASLFPLLLTGAITLFESGLMASLRVMGSALTIVLPALLVLGSLAYLVVALLNGGRYCVVFEMDDHSVNHTQMHKQFQKNQVLAFLTVLAGAAAGSPQTAGAGLLAGSKQSSTSTFSKVKSIVIHPRRHVIYVNEAFNKNHVYAPPAFYETVQNHLIAHCPKAKQVRK